mgnify:CR=1 FL=1
MALLQGLVLVAMFLQKKSVKRGKHVVCWEGIYSIRRHLRHLIRFIIHPHYCLFCSCRRDHQDFQFSLLAPHGGSFIILIVAGKKFARLLKKPVNKK